MHGIIDSLLQLILISLYGPNDDRPRFFRYVGETIKEMSEGNKMPIIMCGDLNIALDQALDTNFYLHENNPRAKLELLQLMKEFDLVDIYRKHHPFTRRYTWRRLNPTIRQARLDYVLVSQELADMASFSDILPGIRTDHSIVSTSLTIASHSRGRGWFKLNTALLKDNSYLEKMKETVIDTFRLYAPHVYSEASLREDLGRTAQLKMECGRFWEVLIVNLRTQTVSYAIKRKKCRSGLQNNLLTEIKHLEKKLDDNVTDPSLQDRLQEKRQELDAYRSELTDGLLVRSRANWLEHGEKSTSYFLRLQRKNWINRRIPYLSLNGRIITNQIEIMEHATSFYTELFRERDEVDNFPLENTFSDLITKKLSETENTQQSKKLELNEIEMSLRRMANNKTPGSTGFPVEFYKILWSHLKHYLYNMFLESYGKAELPLSCREGILILIPKAGKPRHELKSYRPLTLLNTSYKILAGAIGARLKKTLDHLIGPEQTAYIEGRSICDNTRLTYDVIESLSHSESEGLMLSLDIEGAFNSLSWNWIRSTLKARNFPSSTIDWFNTLYARSYSRLTYITVTYRSQFT